MPQTHTLTVALAQLAPVWLDREATLIKVLNAMDQAAAASRSDRRNCTPTTSTRPSVSRQGS